MIIGDRLVYTAPPKCATTWCHEVLEQAGVGNRWETRALLKVRGLQYEHHARWQDIPPDLLEGRVLVTTTRRVTSWRKSWTTHFGMDPTALSGTPTKVAIPHWPWRLKRTEVPTGLWAYLRAEFVPGADHAIAIEGKLRDRLAKVLEAAGYDPAPAHSVPPMNVTAEKTPA